MGLGAGVLMSAQGAGAGLSMMGSFNQASTQQSVLDYESTVAANNAIVANYQASVAQQVGASQVQTSDLRTGAMLGEQKATLGANNVVMSEGSGADILTSTAYMGLRDAATIQDNTNRQVWADRVNASSFTAEAGADKAIAGSINPYLAGGTSLLTGATSVAGSYYNLRRAGAI